MEVEGRVAFGMRDTLLVQCKEVIEILREELAEERRLRGKTQGELLAEKRQSGLLESEKSLLEGRVEELTKQVQSLQNLSFLEGKKKGMLEARIGELTETLRLTQTKNEELTSALASSQANIQETVRKLGTSEGAVFKDLQVRYSQCKASEQELLHKLETVLQDNQRLNRELMGGRRSEEMERKAWTEIGETEQSQKGLKAVSEAYITPRNPQKPQLTLSPEASANPPQRLLSYTKSVAPVRLPPSPSASLGTFHFEAELEKQKQEHEDLLQRLHCMVKDLKPGQKEAM